MVAAQVAAWSMVVLLGASCIGHWGHVGDARRPLSEQAMEPELASFTAEVTGHLPGFWTFGVDLTSASCRQRITSRDEVVTTERWRPGSGIKLQLFVGLAGVASGLIVLLGSDENHGLGYLLLGASGLYLVRPIASAFPRSRTRTTTSTSDRTEQVDCGALVAPDQFTLITPWGARAAARPGCQGGVCLQGTTGDFYFEYEVTPLQGLTGTTLRDRIRGAGRWELVHRSGQRVAFGHGPQLIEMIAREIASP